MPLVILRPMTLNLLVLATVFATVVISGVFGIAGGMMLMAVLVSTLPVSAAMMLHDCGSDLLIAISEQSLQQ